MPDPLRFDEIFGQDASIGRLRKHMATGRLHHTLLFAGPKGVGRRTTGFVLARRLLCLNPQPDGEFTAACGQCEACRLTSKGTHPDLHHIYKELARYHPDATIRGRTMQNLGIDVVRHFFIAPAGQKSTLGKGKVFILTEAELLSREAQNCLLKTLEEPPEDVHIILTCSTPDVLLPTVRSRSSLFHFSPLPQSQVAERLAAQGGDPNQAAFWAGFTNGSLGTALQFANSELYGLKREIITKLAALRAAGDADLGETLNNIASNIAEEYVKAAKSDDDAKLSVTLAKRQSTAVLLKLIAAAFSDAMCLAVGLNRPLIHADQPEEIAIIANRFSEQQLADVLSQLDFFEQALWRNANARLVWDNVVLSAANAKSL